RRIRMRASERYSFAWRNGNSETNCSRRCTATSGVNMDPLSDALREITGALNRIGIRYAIGGSLASSACRVWRTTLDVDVVAAMAPSQAASLADALGKDWYVHVDEARRAIEEGRAFNVI